MAWLSDDADRTRRCFHDFWLIRLCYPLGLLMPFIASFPGQMFWQIYGAFLFILWLGGLNEVRKKKLFMRVPEDQGLLRNMIYFPEEEKLDQNC